ncbi:MAG TPA: hypothetical protein VIV57_22385 [Anaeromyxobacter sp.]
MRSDAMCWEQQDERTWTMQLAGGGAEWLEVKRIDTGAEPAWRVDARLNGSHYKIADAFPTKEAAQGCALLLAMRQVPASRDGLHAQLDALPGAWWWKIIPIDDASAERRCIFSSRVMDSAEAAERSGRAAGAGWFLYVYGPGSVQTFGQLPR